MLGGLVAVAITIWFYKIAASKGVPAAQWGIAGLISFYVPNFIWSLLVAKPWLASLHNQGAAFKSSLVGHSSIFVGAAVAYVVWLVFLRNAKSAETPST
ncbi:hypothetical protein [Methylococcus sp. EFPC2]|uniref:hypothetical protein n=1 Tax=Methylococcus sp. EFPC2 TaxID=2812648 RepID=UPI00196705D1|nr:hypothetical protein [Methylococcus sp. EFPC2]QSA96681.1 hypothetical protein JWZ97_15925 [Methylococcus sp. EFPC2]